MPTQARCNGLCQRAVSRRIHRSPLRWLLTATCVAALTLSRAHGAEGTTATPQGEDAHAWLQRMSQALANRNYDGRFLHLVGGHAENMRIIHRVDRGGVTERLVSLDGSGREVIRTDTEVTCYLPDRRTVLVERRKDHDSLLATVPTYSENLHANYTLAAPMTTRVLGRTVQVVTVQPRDEFRYGYRLWLDKETAMPLKSQLCDRDGRVLEQVIFSDLRMPDEIDNEQLRTSIVTDGFRWVRQDARAQRLPKGAPGAEQNGWIVVNPPTGFRLTVTRMQSFGGDSVPVRHMVFSDGIASVSVFIEPVDAGHRQRVDASHREGADAGHREAIDRTVQPTAPVAPSSPGGEVGLMRVGTAFAFTIQSQAHRITAIGEAPASTVQAIAAAVREGEPAKASEKSPDIAPDTRDQNRAPTKAR